VPRVRDGGHGQRTRNPRHPHRQRRAAHFVRTDLAKYHIATCADGPSVEAFWIDEDDPHLWPGGGKGIGEIGITGTAAAIGNAVWHATGRRVRDLPITPARLLSSGT
jgi:xanthine dehydrogenase YagR molybdenum-binding subunit